MINDVNVSSPYKTYQRPKGWKPLPSPKDIKKKQTAKNKGRRSLKKAYG